MVCDGETSELFKQYLCKHRQNGNCRCRLPRFSKTCNNRTTILTLSNDCSRQYLIKPIVKIKALIPPRQGFMRTTYLRILDWSIVPLIDWFIYCFSPWRSNMSCLCSTLMNSYVRQISITQLTIHTESRIRYTLLVWIDHSHRGTALATSSGRVACRFRTAPPATRT